MPRVEMTSHLYRFFPSLEEKEIEVQGETVAEVIVAMDQLAPGFSHYIVNDHGALRPHVNLSIGESMVIDKKCLSDRVKKSDTVFIFQALSGG